MFTTCGQCESKKTNTVCSFHFKPNTDSFIRSIYYNICMLIYKKKKILRKLITLRLHYNADSIITWSKGGSQIFVQYTMCENISRRSWYTQCKL